MALRVSGQFNGQAIQADFVSPAGIVVASDLTDTQMLLPHVAAQAKLSNASVTLVHAIRNSPVAIPEEQIEEDSYARQTLGAMKSSLERQQVRCSVTVRRGAPAEVVAQEIATAGAGRLIIGTHPHGSCGQNMIGSVANALLLAAPVPVCVIGPQANTAAAHAYPRRILHPILPSGLYLEGACFAAKIAQAYGAQLVLLHVMSPASATGPYASVFEVRLREEVENSIRIPAVRLQTIVEYGDTIDKILSHSVTENIDWIVMGITRDFPWWSKQNNHAYQVIAGSRCPVLTFHDRILAHA